MNIDTDKIKKIYDELIQHVKDDDKKEFYKKAAEMAISMGISRQQWEEDRKRMEKMENLILEELEPGMLQEEDMDQKIRSVQKRILDIYLPENDENAQKEFLKKILTNLEVDEREIQNLTVEQLRERLILESNEWSQDYFLRRLVDICREEVKANKNQNGMEDIDPEVWRTAGYLAVPELREYPEILSGISGSMRLCKVLKYTLEFSEVLIGVIFAASTFMFLFCAGSAFYEFFTLGITELFIFSVQVMLVTAGGITLSVFLVWLSDYLNKKIKSSEDANRWVLENSSALYLDNNGNQVKVEND